MTRPPMVLHARVVRGAGGGPEKTILNSPRFLKPGGYSSVCTYLRDPADADFAEVEHRAKRWQAPLEVVDDHGPFDWRLPARLREVCSRYQPNIWHGHEYKTNLLGLVLRRSHPMRLVTTVHGWVERTWKTPLYYAIDRLCLRRYDHVICVSDDLHDRCLGLGIPPEKCWLVPNAIDTDEFRRRQPRRKAKRDLGIDPARLVVGAIGRLSDEKGFDRLIRAVHALAAEGLNIELQIAGEGPRRSDLDRLISSLGLGERAKLVGFRSDIAAFYHPLDVFVLSSIREGLPNVVLEAMAFELPILAARVAGVPKLIRDGHNGLLVEPGSVDELTQRLRGLLLDKQLRHRLGRQARQTVEESYGFQHRMERIREVYDRVLSSSRTGE